jgi:chromosome partitioning protein
MRTVALLTQKGGAGKTTLAASLAVAAAGAGERVIALDFDQQASLVRWGKRREAAHAPDAVITEPFEVERLRRLGAVIDGLAGAGFTLAVFDTPGADSAAVRLVAEFVDLCLLPVRPTRLDLEATAATFRTVYLARRNAAFVLNQCPPANRSARSNEAAKELSRLGVLAEPAISARIDFQDAMAAGLGVTEHASAGRAAQEIEALWSWIRLRLQSAKGETSVNGQPSQQPATLSERLARVAHIERLTDPTEFKASR